MRRRRRPPPRHPLLGQALLISLSFAAACTHGPATPAAHTGHDAIGAQPATVVVTEEEYAAARGDLDALSPEDKTRATRRRPLADYLIKEVNVALDRGHAEDADGPLRQALSLYSAAELRRAAESPAPDAAPLIATARRYELVYRKRGAHEQVLTALAAQIALGGTGEGVAAARARWREVTGWLEGASADEDIPDGASRVLDDLESIARVLPAPFVVDELAQRYRAPRPAAPPRSAKPSLRQLRELMGEGGSGSRAYELARLYLRVSDPKRARKEVQTLAEKKALQGDDNDLLQLLDKINGQEASATDWVALAMYVITQSRSHGVDDRDVALRVCRDAAERFDKAIEPRLCAGQLALSMEQLVVAMRNFEAVRAIDPSRREAWENLARIYQARLFQVVTEENLDTSRLPAQLAKLEEFHADAQRRFPGSPLSPGLASAVFEVGRGYYNGGKIAEAEKYLNRSIDLEPSTSALELLATIRLKRGDPQRAAVLIERAINLGKGSKEEQLYHRAKLRRMLADAIEAAGDTQVAEETRRGAVQDWDVLLDLGLQKEFVSEGQLERGKVLYQLGERDDALRAFARSIDALPDRGSSYADVIAFLIPRGELAEALDAYHRALGRNEVTDYLKVYCSLWIVDLAQRAGQPEDPLALAYLRAADGNKWFDDLARWATGRQTEAELMARANTTPRRAEALFYRALKALRAGHRDEAKQLWAEVTATDMMAFFEFDMAAMYLKDGAPSAPRIQSRPKSKATRPTGKPGAQATEAPSAPHGSPPARRLEPPPDGSI